MESIWRKQTRKIAPKTGADFVKIPETRWDAIIVGAGMAGLLTAYYLKERGKKVLVLEADRIASGQTERTTAKITSQHALKYSKLIQKVGAGKAGLYAQANEAAIREYEWLIRKCGIDCQFERTEAYLYTLQDTDLLEKEAGAASSLGIKASVTSETELPFPVKKAVCFHNQAQFSPLEFVRFLAAELEIWEYTKVLTVKGNCVVAERTAPAEQPEPTGEKSTSGQKVVLTADRIIIAAHYPIKNVPGFYFLRQHQERSYVVALSGCKKIKGMYYGIDEDGLSVRQAGDYLLLGGSSHRTGDNDSGGAYEFLEKAAAQYFLDGKVEARWSAQDCMPHDGIPFIGRYSVFTPHLYVATGFQKWGMTSAMIAAMILRDELCGVKNPYAKLFRPQRLNLRASFGNLLVDVGMSIKGLTKGFLHRPGQTVDSLLPGHGGIVAIDGKKYACYRDEAGELHQISARCSHMGCELTWNPDEKSWDCPCHGSRFDVDGRLLDNPAKRDAAGR